MPHTISSRLTRKLSLAAVMAAGLTLSACATHSPTQSGFLSDYSQPQSQQVDLSRYHAAIIDDVSYRPSGHAPASPSQAEIDTMTAAYRSSLIAAFGERFRIVDETGKDVIRVRAAVTGYSFANPAWNALSLAVPIGPRNGGVSTESEVVDSVSGASILTQSSSFNGHIWNASPTAMFDRDGHAQTGFRKHADDLAARIVIPSGVSATPEGTDQ